MLLSALGVWSWLCTSSHVLSLYVIVHIHVYVSHHTCTSDPPDGSSSILVVFLLISGHLIAWSPHVGLVEAAISTQHSPQTTWKAFFPARCCLSFKKKKKKTTTFLIHLPLKPNCLICILSITSQQAPATWRRTRGFPFSSVQFQPQVFHFALKRVAKAVGRRSDGLSTQTRRRILTTIGMGSEKPRRAGAWRTFPSFLSLCLSEREPLVACCVAADKAGPFVCGSHIEGEAGRHLSKHLPAIDLPLRLLNRSIRCCRLRTHAHLRRGRHERG